MIPLATLHPYTFEFDATVTRINDDGTVELDTTYFYATGGGQPNDLGTIRHGEEEYRVTDVRKKDGHIVHAMDRAGLAEGDTVHCIIDGERRTKLMRMHTATHILCSVLERREGAMITGNQIGTEKTRVDFSLEKYDPERLKEYVEEANRIIAANPPVRKYATTRDALLANPALVKLAMGFPEGVTDVHMVEIEGADTQPCGGTNVDAVSEIGTLVFDHAESKGTKNRRVYFRLE